MVLHNTHTYVCTHLSTLEISPEVNFLFMSVPAGGKDVVLLKSNTLRTESLPGNSIFPKSSFRPPNVFPSADTLVPLNFPDSDSVFGAVDRKSSGFERCMPAKFCTGKLGNGCCFSFLIIVLSKGQPLASDSLIPGNSSSNDFLALFKTPYKRSICLK